MQWSGKTVFMFLTVHKTLANFNKDFFNWASHGLSFIILVLSILLTVFTKLTDDWMRIADLWCREPNRVRNPYTLDRVFLWQTLVRPLGRNPGLVVLGGGSCSKGLEFEFQHCMDIYSHLLVVKIIMCVRKDKNKWKRGQGWCIFNFFSNFQNILLILRKLGKNLFLYLTLGMANLINTLPNSMIIKA